MLVPFFITGNVKLKIVGIFSNLNLNTEIFAVLKQILMQSKFNTQTIPYIQSGITFHFCGKVMLPLII